MSAAGTRTLSHSRAIDRVLRSSLRPGFVATTTDTVSLALGEPDFPTPAPIIEAMERALREGYTHYSDFQGDPELRTELAQVASRAAGTSYEASQVVVTHGGTAGIVAAILATVDPGDRVIIPEPTFSLYADAVHMAGGEPVLVPIQDDYHLDLDALSATLPGARMVVYCNPCNPTGAVLGRAELEQLGTLLEGTDTLVLSDEAYDSFVYDGADFTSALAVPSLRERLVYCQTFSKNYAMTGWRVGYVVAPRDLAAPIARVHRTFNSSSNTAVQRAALVAVRASRSLSEPMLAEYQARRTLTMSLLRQVEGLTTPEPAGAFYAFSGYDVDIPAVDLVARLAAGGVAVRAGTEFGPGGEHHLRFSFAASAEELKLGLARFAETYAQVRSGSLR